MTQEKTGNKSKFKAEEIIKQGKIKRTHKGNKGRKRIKHKIVKRENVINKKAHL